MRSGWTAFTNTGLKLLLCLPLLSIFVLFVPDDTLGKGGTNMHEGLAGSRAAVPTYEPTLPSEGFGGTRPHLFSNAPVFLSEANIGGMARIVRAIETATQLAAYREAVLSWAPDVAHHDFGPRGAFMGYDFHLSAEGPKLIEINTNAGGAFLNVLLAKAQRACCAEVEVALSRSEADEFETLVLRMFEREWELQRRRGGPRRVRNRR